MSDHLFDYDLEQSTLHLCCLASRLVDALVHLALDLHRFDCLWLLLLLSMQLLLELSTFLVVVCRAHLVPQLLSECVLDATNAQQTTSALRQLIFFIKDQYKLNNYKSPNVTNFIL